MCGAAVILDAAILTQWFLAAAALLEWHVICL